MGFDLYIRRFRNGEPAPYQRKIAEDIFDRDAKSPSGMQYVEYQDGRGEIYCGKEGEEFDGFMLSHFGGTTICERALEIAHNTQSLIFWPSTHILFAVTDRATLAHLPRELFADETIVTLVQTVGELWVAINAEKDSSDGVVIVFPEV